MNAASLRLPRILGALLALAVPLAGAQTSGSYEPHVGQPGRDVVWVPTSQALVDKMLDMAKVVPQDFVMDLGSGDGRTVIAAAKRGAHALGIEYNPDMVELSRKNAKAAGVSARASFVKADLFETDLSKASVITMFLLPDINLKLRPKLLGLKPGTRVVSNTFTMAEWQPDETAELPSGSGCGSWCKALLWIVPAKVEGDWKLPQGELALKQDFQMLHGTLTTGGKSFALEGRVRGEDVSFHAGGRRYHGRMKGGKLVLN
jgi:SAM-dependent methyltransferase